VGNAIIDSFDQGERIIDSAKYWSTRYQQPMVWNMHFA
jgi:hypothetical protein